MPARGLPCPNSTVFSLTPYPHFMKKNILLLSFLAAVASVRFAYAQNSFPTTVGSSVGIGTSTPSTTFQIIPATGNGVLIGNVTYPSWMGNDGLYVNGQIWSHYLILGSTLGWGDNRAQILGWSTGADSYLKFNTNATERLRVDINGKVGIGTTVPDQLLTVNGTIHAKQVNIDLSVPGPDYVFDKSYRLKPLSAVEKYVIANKHLPEIPAASTMEKDGVNVNELNMKLLQKVEELTLYLIEKDKENKDLKREMSAIKRQLESLTKTVNKK